ncbi:MAG TPA: glutathione-disulfide reductase [Gammaproteobacteria bacterium]
MTKRDYDLFVIGAGSGGVRAARMSAGLGARVAIAEERYLGGTCVNVGCIPKKLLVYAAHFRGEFDDAGGYGWSVGETAFDWSRLIQNKNREIGRLNGVYEKLLLDAGAEILRGRARLIDPHSVEIGGRVLRAERILVATGAWPAIPEFPGREHVISSNEAFFLETLPRRVIVVGGGYIAVEFAGIFNGLGAATSLAYRGPLFLRGFDGDAREALAGEMRRRNIELLFNTNVSRIDRGRTGLTVRFDDAAPRETDLVLYATGRRPNTAGIGLEEAGVKLDGKGAVIVDEDLRSSVPNIHALGDVTNRINLTPVATAEGSALARTLFGGQPTRVDYGGIPTCVFSQPPLAAVGLTEEQAREKHGDIDVYRSAFTPLRHTLTGRAERTFMKLVVRRSDDRVVGAHMVGADAGEIIQGIAIAMKAGATKAQFDQTIGIHPTSAEEFVTMRKPA